VFVEEGKVLLADLAKRPCPVSADACSEPFQIGPHSDLQLLLFLRGQRGRGGRRLRSKAGQPARMLMFRWARRGGPEGVRAGHSTYRYA
jgi:hypothetical protein